jgi:hypothetical protein
MNPMKLSGVASLVPEGTDHLAVIAIQDPDHIVTAIADQHAQFVYNTNNVGKFATGKDKVGRIDAISVETGKTV